MTLGPSQKEALFYRIRDENDKRIHHTYQGRERTRYQREKENWEEAKVNTKLLQRLLAKSARVSAMHIVKLIHMDTYFSLIDEGVLQNFSARESVLSRIGARLSTCRIAASSQASSQRRTSGSHQQRNC